jgi:hypothetical protein
MPIISQAGMHDARNSGIVCGLLVKLDALNEGGGAVTHADDGDADFVVGHDDVLLGTKYAGESQDKAVLYNLTVSHA